MLIVILHPRHTKWEWVTKIMENDRHLSRVNSFRDLRGNNITPNAVEVQFQSQSKCVWLNRLITKHSRLLSNSQIMGSVRRFVTFPMHFNSNFVKYNSVAPRWRCVNNMYGKVVESSILIRKGADERVLLNFIDAISISMLSITINNAVL